MTTLLDAARQALPGLDWGQEDGSAVYRMPMAPHDTHLSARTGANPAMTHCVADGYGQWRQFKSAAEAAQWLRAQVTARRDALDAALGEPQHLGTSARDWCGMWDIARARADVAEAKLKALVASWPAHYHRQGCPWGACNCGADAANAARTEARRLCGVGNA
jgi:hypothetical protein